jgi:hypothetical protein
MKARLRSVFSHSTTRWEPSDIRSEDSGQRSTPDARSTALHSKDKPNERVTFHIKSSSSRSPLCTNQNSQLLRPRKSAISLTSVPDRELDARTNFQWQATFFAKLPLEVRRMVYGYLYEGKTIHLKLGEKKEKLGRKEVTLGNFVCMQERVGQCTCRVVVAGSPLETSLPQLEGAQLALARTCRRTCVYPVRLFILSSIPRGSAMRCLADMEIGTQSALTSSTPTKPSRSCTQHTLSLCPSVSRSNASTRSVTCAYAGRSVGCRTCVVARVPSLRIAMIRKSGKRAGPSWPVWMGWRV